MRQMPGILMLLLCCIFLTSCWDYRGLDDIDIVTGFAVDKDEGSGLYRLTFELVDTQASDKEEGTAVVYVTAEGETLFDAIRNAKKKLINKLYGGNMQTLIISRQIAQEEGISVILEEILRDGEPRETMSVAISQEETAAEILQSKGIDSKLIAYEVHEMVEEDSKVTAATVSVPLFKAYNAIKGTGNALVLPAIRCVQNEGETVSEGNGIALFRDDRLDGFLTATQTKWYLFVVDKAKGGVLSFPVSDSEQRISMEMKDSKTNRNVTYSEGQVRISLSITVNLNVTEVKSQLNLSQSEHRKALERLTEDYLETSIRSFFEEVQQQNKRDIFGLGRLIYQKNPQLWRSLEPNWDTLFQNAVLDVQAKANIQSSGVLKQY